MIFFSWSKENSKMYASITKDFFNSIFKTDNLVWFSVSNIESGKVFLDEILNSTDCCDSIILFLTKENIYNPWIQFELGLFFGKRNCHIWPVCFDENLNQNTTAFEHINVLSVNKETFKSIIEQIFIIYQEKIAITKEEVIINFDKLWDGYFDQIRKVNNPFYYLGDADIHDLVCKFNDECKVLGKEGSVFRVDSGFETHDFYKFLLKNTHRRLWVFGRKNKKLFDRGNIKFFEDFRKSDNGNFSLKILFLDPQSEKLLLENAQKKKNFEDSLITCINDAIEILDETGFDQLQTIKLYRRIRNDAIIISDNIVYFENVKYSEDMKPYHLTDSGFFITTTETCIGKYYLDLFQDVWNISDKYGEE